MSKLNNVPTIKSVFYPIKNFPNGSLGDSWCYTTGVYDGQYRQVIGKGGEGIVICGEWNERPVAYKFVEMKGLKWSTKYDASMVDMNQRLKEMTEMMETPGDSILPFEAHFR